jgi:phosphatidylserine/phosphatidylglycerophosphate/cardiolipin synthase-like enzyme
MIHPLHPPADRIVISCDERRHVVLEMIRQARSRIALSLFRCNDKALFAELTAAVNRGVDVQVLVTSRAKGGKRTLEKLWTRLDATGASVHAYTDAVVKYHAKYLVVDEGPALIASLNFTRKCFARTCDAMVVTYDPEVVAGLRALMEADRHGRPAPDFLSERLIVGPERARRQYTALLTQARSSIRLIDAKLSDPALMALLNTRWAEGVTVEIYRDKYLTDMKSHGKIMLIDDARAVVGSLALTALSLDFRREVAVVCDEPAAVAAVGQLFQSIAATSAARSASVPI